MVAVNTSTSEVPLTVTVEPVAKEKRYLEATIGKMENELKVRSMRPHKVTT